MAQVGMKELLEAGVHFGHQTRRWNPKMKDYIFIERSGIYIIDLHQTLKRLETAYQFVEQVAAEGGKVLFVGTKKQAQDAVRESAARCEMFYVTERWLGGMLTNHSTINQRIERLRELRTLIQNLEVTSRVCFDHFLNVWYHEGPPRRTLFTQDYNGYKFPEQKEEVLELIEEGLRLDESLHLHVKDMIELRSL